MPIITKGKQAGQSMTVIKKKGGWCVVKTYHTTSSSGYMQLYVQSNPMSWGKVWGYMEWEFTPDRDLIGVQVSSNMEADIKVFAWFASCEMWFTLEVVGTGKKDEIHWWWGNFVDHTEYKNEVLSINFGAMSQGTTYRIRSTITFRADNDASVDAESGQYGIYGGYAKVINQVVYEPGC